MPKRGYKQKENHKNKIRESCKNCPVIHHINGNHFDDRPENRLILTPYEHAQVHMIQGDIHLFKKGEKFSEEIKNKMKGNNNYIKKILRIKKIKEELEEKGGKNV